MVETTAKFSFHFLEGREFPSIDCKETQELLLKWSMKGRLVAQAFSFDQAFQTYEKDAFTLAFFQDPEVIHHLKVVSSSGSLTTLGATAKSVSVDQIPCTQLSMSFFDRLQENGIVRESGRISKCFDEQWEDFSVSDELRKVNIFVFCIVQKNSSTGELHIVSSIFKVTALDATGVIYPSDSDHLQNFAYLIVHPLKRNVYVLYHSFGASF
ncbi:hypothetical protein CAPTEDRAFT_204568 [Capitella teleta]|uniref:Cilia- and flagella-associated protein 300 n=1 Tax=Capitella teleta TaxID=283909 RepID=R7TWN3_CAPTE|nr:hypothetical protein CAPTEDRAFT_204568 [Capitella teleta]|eukprot:ELT98022.1 hypothetical protein CAPTEDRAFT_204568 [Capitella teleta]